MTQENFTTFNDNDNEIELGRVLRHILMQSKMIIIIVAIAFTISLILYLNSTKKYEIVSLIQVESFNQNILDPTNTLEMAGSLNGGSTDMENLVLLYKSRTNILKLIIDLNLNTEIPKLNEGENIDFTIKSFIADQHYSDIFYVDFKKNTFLIYDEEDQFLSELSYGNKYNFENGPEILINGATLNNNRKLKFIHTNPSSLYNTLKKSIQLKTSGKRNYLSNAQGLIEIKYVTPDINRGKEIIDYANKIFLEQRIYNETQKSRAAINFIEENIETLQKVVELNKRKLKDFREKNKSIDIDLETQAILSKIQDIDESLVDIDFELINANEIYTSTNPIYTNLLNRKAIIQNQRDAILSQIENMPKEQQEFIDLFNEVEISQALYEELETRRLAFSILEASTIGDIKIVDSAYLSVLVSPKFFSVILTSIIFLFGACLIAIIRGSNFLPISNPAEITDNNINYSLVGVVPLIEDNKDSIDDDNRFNSALESLIVNIRSIQREDHEKKYISFTSASPSNGKSTISLHSALHLAKIGKRVLLVDNDLKRGNINEDFDVRKLSEKDFFNLSSDNIDKLKIKENFYLLPRVKGLLNSFQFVCSIGYQDKIKELGDMFDYVIFDTAPFLSVAETSVIMERSHLNFLIVRHNMNKINEVKQCVNNLSQIDITLDGIIYNAYAKPQGYYGYYGYYGNYAYQYYSDRYLSDAYDYKKDD